MTSKRLDMALVDRELVPTRARAQSLIQDGKILVNRVSARKASQKNQ